MTQDQRAAAGDPDAGAAVGTAGGADSSAAGATDGAATTTEPGAPDGPARLERSRQHKVVGGVCGGLGRHFDVDPVIFRVPLAVLSVFGGLSLIFYGFAWLIIPMEGEEENEGRRLLSGRVEGASLAALLAALAGCGLLLASLGGGRGIGFTIVVALAIGAAVYWSRHRRQTESEESQEPLPDAPPEAQAPPVPSTPSWWREPLTKDTSTGYLWGPEDAPYEVAPSGGQPAPREPDTGDVPCREGGIGGLTFLAAIFAVLIGTGAAWSSQPLDTALVIGLSCALAVFGLGLVISAFVGRVGGGTIVSVALIGVLLAGAVALPNNISTNWTEVTWSPAATAEVREEYEFGSGRGVLDLTGIELAEDERLRTAVTVGAGELRVIVPENAKVDIEFEAGAGGYRLPGGVSGGGIGLSESHTVAPRDVGEANGTVELKIELGLGEAVIEQAEQKEAPK